MPDSFFQLTPGDDGIAHLQLNRPERMNTLAPSFFTSFRDAVLELDAAGRTRVLVISSTGRHFSAGMSLEVFAGGMPMLDTSDARKRLAFQNRLRQLMRCFDVLEQAQFPVIAAIQGGCIGGALDLATACDLRLCTKDAFFSVQEINIGMAADLGVLQRLPKIVPPALAREMAYTGERLGADRALAAGLVNAVLTDAGALRERVFEMARQIAAKSPLAVAGSKRALNFAVDHPTGLALEQMTLLQSAIIDLDEMQRAIVAWKDKRVGEFAALEPLEPLEPPASPEAMDPAHGA